jgi:hypothetical protein
MQEEIVLSTNGAWSARIGDSFYHNVTVPEYEPAPHARSPNGFAIYCPPFIFMIA